MDIQAGKGEWDEIAIKNRRTQAKRLTSTQQRHNPAQAHASVQRCNASAMQVQIK
jgi:hypothetical protein